MHETVTFSMKHRSFKRCANDGVFKYHIQPEALTFFLCTFIHFFFFRAGDIQGHTCHAIKALTAELMMHLFSPSVVLGSICK